MIAVEKDFVASVAVGRKLICNQTLMMEGVWFPPMTPLVIHEIEKHDYGYAGTRKMISITYLVFAPEGWTDEQKFYLGGFALDSKEHTFAIIKED